jgi:molybdate transport repressor ModE-like protein
MWRLQIHPRWQLGSGSEDDAENGSAAVDATALISLLAAIQETGGIAQAARTLGLSYRHAWGRIRQAEALFGLPLIEAGRGRGSALSPLAEKLIWAQRRVTARLTPLMDSLASELAHEIDRTLPQPPQAVRLNASHGFAVATLLDQMQAAGLPVELRYRSSLESVAALAHGECDLAGFHVPIGEFQAAAAEHYRRWLRPDRHSLVHLAVRTQGIFVAPGNPKRIRSLQDLKRADVRFVNRPEGSGTRMLTELMLQKQGIAHDELHGWGDTELTHAAIAAYIASGMADAGIGVQTAALRFGLHFIPLVRERYFFALPSAELNRPPVKPVLALLNTPSCRAAIAALVGYDAAETGRVLSLGDAFG